MKEFMVFRTKQDAEDYRAEHPYYSRLEHVELPFKDDAGKKCHWVLVLEF